MQRGTEAWGSAAVSRLLLRDGATGANGFRQPGGGGGASGTRARLSLTS